MQVAAYILQRQTNSSINLSFLRSSELRDYLCLDKFEVIADNNPLTDVLTTAKIVVT